MKRQEGCTYKPSTRVDTQLSDILQGAVAYLSDYTFIVQLQEDVKHEGTLKFSHFIQSLLSIFSPQVEAGWLSHLTQALVLEVNRKSHIHKKPTLLYMILYY